MEIACSCGDWSQHYLHNYPNWHNLWVFVGSSENLFVIVYCMDTLIVRKWECLWSPIIVSYSSHAVCFKVNNLYTELYTISQMNYQLKPVDGWMGATRVQLSHLKHTELSTVVLHHNRTQKSKTRQKDVSYVIMAFKGPFFWHQNDFVDANIWLVSDSPARLTQWLPRKTRRRSAAPYEATGAR